MRTPSDDEITQEIAWVDNEPGWPRWPLLPVKNINRGEPGYPEEEEVGVILANGEQNGPRRVYFKNLWDFQAGKIQPQLEGVAFKDFATTEEMVRAGWVGD